jgi:hypothetical protein
MTKIYRSIDADVPYDADVTRVRDARAVFEQARSLFRNFRENFEEWVYRELLPKTHASDRPETHMEKAIRTSAWDLRHELDAHQLFPVFHPSKEPDWSKLRHERDRNIKRYQLKATKALKEIDDYLEMSPEGKVERYIPVDHLEVGGVHVVLLNFGRDDDDQNDLESFLRSLRQRVDEIKRSGFGGAVKGLTVTVDFDTKAKEWATTGMYQPATDTLSMYSLGIVGDDSGHGTFVHECGHRFYFRELPVQARNHWEEVMMSRSVKITRDDVRRFADLIIRKVDSQTLRALDGDDDRLRAVLPHAGGAADEAKFRELAKMILMPWDVKVFDPAAYTKFLETKVGEPVLIEETTDYGNTNPMEAFAEVFRLWITKGPRAVKPWTREFFSQVCGLGGAKLAATRVAERYLSLQGVA